MTVNWDLLADRTVDLVLNHGGRIFIALAGAWIALHFLKLAVGFLRRTASDESRLGTMRLDRKQTETVANILQHTGTAVILFVVGLMVLTELGFNLAPILASAGIVGVAVGLGSQSLVKDVIAGLFVLLEDYYRVGDVIRTGGHTGLVERLTLRTTYLRDGDGALHMVPNGDLGRVSNLSRDWGKAFVEVEIAYREDLDKAMRVLAETAHQLAAEWPTRILEKPEVLGIEQFGASGILLKIAAKTAPMEQAAVARELRKRIKQAFEHEHVAFPQTYVAAP